jgi:hypothetical protein
MNSIRTRIKRDDASKNKAGNEVRGNVPLAERVEVAPPIDTSQEVLLRQTGPSARGACGLIWTRRTRRGDWHHTTKQLGHVSDSAYSMDPTHPGSDDAANCMHGAMHGHTQACLSLSTHVEKGERQELPTVGTPTSSCG